MRKCRSKRARCATATGVSAAVVVVGCWHFGKDVHVFLHVRKQGLDPSARCEMQVVDGEVFSEPSSTPQADPVSRHGKQKQASKQTPIPANPRAKVKSLIRPCCASSIPSHARPYISVRRNRHFLPFLCTAPQATGPTHRNACLYTLPFRHLSPILTDKPRTAIPSTPPRPPRRGKSFRL